MSQPYKKKLIEVALPLEVINTASAREKSIRHGHPSTLHLWWARRPLAAARAVIFAQMVDDPSAHPDLFPSEKAQEKERKRLFKIIEELVQWENTTNEDVLQRARNEIWQSWRRTCAENSDHPSAKELFDRHKLPSFHDPFAGGGTLPLEAQRLGLESCASDLNPVAVLINKAMIEIPPQFAGNEPTNPEWQRKSREEKTLRQWKGAQGLAEDVRYYGSWMREEAEKRIGHLYPEVRVTADMAENRPDLQPYVGKNLTVIAWLWARTVRSPNPAFSTVDVPLVSTFVLSSNAGKEVYIEPVVTDKSYRFDVKVGTPSNAENAKRGTTAGKRNAFRCLLSGVPVTYDHIRKEGQAGRLGTRLLALVAQTDAGKTYISPTVEMEEVAKRAVPDWIPDTPLPSNPRDFKTPNYGLTTYGSLFIPRQLVGLTTFSNLIGRVREQIVNDAGPAARSYADAVALYLAFAVDKCTDYWCSIATWMPRGTVGHAFSKQAIPMTWDFPEVNPFADFHCAWQEACGWVSKAVETLPARGVGLVMQEDASNQKLSSGRIVSTDPPYYDNIGYAELSDFFYLWLRHSLRQVLPDLFATVAVPKVQELVATPYRHGGKENAEAFFLEGMTKAMACLAHQSHEAYPVTIYYAFKQSETESEGTASTGWETFLEAVISAGFGLSGTWPMRTERTARSIAMDKNALASSIILVCRTRRPDAPYATRREFLAALKAELPAALAHFQRGNIAPVDLAQAAIGPGMAVFTRYSKVIDAEGNPLTVRQALNVINEVLDEVLAEQEGDFDPDTRWALAWFEQFGFAEGEYGVAEILSKAKNTSVGGIADAGIGISKAGKVRLLKPEELPYGWSPDEDKRLTVWEIVHHLIRTLNQGESSAATIVAQLGSKAEVARELAYRLYSICERKKRAQEALAYNGLVQSWPEIMRLARQVTPAATQSGLFEEN
jgi:putative DNA methylase